MTGLENPGIRRRNELSIPGKTVCLGVSAVVNPFV